MAVYPKAILRGRGTGTQRATCFVLMPFSKELKAVYQLIGSTLESPDLNIQCRRADDFSEPNILETIITRIISSEFIIADLTGRNANVFYELGIAHCVKDAKNVIIVTQDIDDIPFDIRHLRCIEYQLGPQGMKSLKSALVDTFKDVCKDRITFKIHSGQAFAIGHRLVGTRRNFFQVSVHCLMLAKNAAKMEVHFEEFSATDKVEPIQPLFAYVEAGRSPVRLEHIPWSIEYLREVEGGALVSLRQF